MANSRVLLLNKDFHGDFENPSNNTGMLIASTTTDQMGKYVLQDIPEGNYGVIPFEDRTSQPFFVATDSDSNLISVSKEKRNFNVCFFAPVSALIGVEDSSQISIKVNSINFPGKSLEKYCRLELNRLCYFFFIPFEVFQNWAYPSSEKSAVDFSLPFGYTTLLMTNSNNLAFKCALIKVEGVHNTNVVESEFTLYYNLPLSGCPSDITLEIDWKNRTIRRTNE